MAQMVLVIGESGTGKSTSLRECDPATTAVVNPVGKPLPFKNHFEMLNNETDARKICKYMREQAAAGKKLIAVDDFQYILAVPYMNRIKETGWDKYNDFGSNYFEIIEVCKDLPEDVVVVYYSHSETLDNGLTAIKLIGKLLREKITIEGLFTVVLRTGVNEGGYYFYTQNSGKDTVKSPMGMFPAYAIENDMNYVADKIRNYYEIGEYKSDAEMEAADTAVASDIPKPDSKGRRARGSASSTSTEQTKERKTRSQVEAENKEKMDKYVEDTSKAVNAIAGVREEVPIDEASAAMDTVAKPELETPPRRRRSERGQKAEQPTPGLAERNMYFYHSESDSYFMTHKGEELPKEPLIEEITLDEFNKGLERQKAEEEANSPMNSPEEMEKPVTRQRKVRGSANTEENTETEEAPVASGRRRRTR